MLTKINTNIVATTYDSIRVQNFHYLTGSVGRNIITFGADISSSVHIDNKGKYILILGKDQHKD